MRPLGAVALLVLLASCAQPRPPVHAQPTGGVAVNSTGNVTAAAGVDTGRVAVGANTSGNVGVAVDVVDRPNVGVTVGTGGSAVTVGNGPVTVGIGTGGRRGLGLWF